MDKVIKKILDDATYDEFSYNYSQNKQLTFKFRNETVFSFKANLNEDSLKEHKKLYMNVSEYWKGFKSDNYIAEHRHYVFYDKNRRVYKAKEHNEEHLQEDADKIETFLFELSSELCSVTDTQRLLN